MGPPLSLSVHRIRSREPGPEVQDGATRSVGRGPAQHRLGTGKKCPPPELLNSNDLRGWGPEVCARSLPPPLVMLMHEKFEKHHGMITPEAHAGHVHGVKSRSGGHHTSLSASSPAARVPPPRNTARCGSSPCAGRRRRSWPGTGQWRCYWGLRGKDGGGNAVLMPRDCETEQSTGTTVCRDRPPIPCEARTQIPKVTPHEGEQSPRFSSPCSRGEGNLPEAQSARCKGKRKEMKNARRLRQWPTITPSVKMLLTIWYRTARLGREGGRDVTVQQQDNEGG